MNEASQPGMIGVIAQETARYTMFAASLTSVVAPEGSTVKWQFGHPIAENCNALVRELLARPELEWLWLLGDDHVFSSDLLLRLLAWEKDIVTPLCLLRAPPYAPVAFTGEEYSSSESGQETRSRVRLRLERHPEGGLVPIHSVGSGGMLIRREVLETLADPWFEAGRLSSVQLGEDLYFCDKAREAGFVVYCDLDASLGHCLTAVVWPVREETGWTFGFSMMGGYQILLPPGSAPA